MIRTWQAYFARRDRLSSQCPIAIWRDRGMSGLAPQFLPPGPALNARVPRGQGRLLCGSQELPPSTLSSFRRPARAELQDGYNRSSPLTTSGQSAGRQQLPTETEGGSLSGTAGPQGSPCPREAPPELGVISRGTGCAFASRSHSGQQPGALQGTPQTLRTKGSRITSQAGPCPLLPDVTGTCLPTVPDRRLRAMFSCQSCPTLQPCDCSRSPGSSVHGFAGKNIRVGAIFLQGSSCPVGSIQAPTGRQVLYH